MAYHFLRCEDGSAINIDHIVRLSIAGGGTALPEIVAECTDSSEHPVQRCEDRDDAEKLLLQALNLLEGIIDLSPGQTGSQTFRGSHSWPASGGGVTRVCHVPKE